jgi:hypothetical protein
VIHPAVFFSRLPPSAARNGCLVLSRIFGGKIPQPPERAPRKAFSREELLIQLLAAEHSDEELDDGELEGLGDDYEEDE